MGVSLVSPVPTFQFSRPIRDTCQQLGLDWVLKSFGFWGFFFDEKLFYFKFTVFKKFLFYVGI